MTNAEREEINEILIKRNYMEETGMGSGQYFNDDLKIELTVAGQSVECLKRYERLFRNEPDFVRDVRNCIFGDPSLNGIIYGDEKDNAPRIIRSLKEIRNELACSGNNAHMIRFELSEDGLSAKGRTVG